MGNSTEKPDGINATSENSNNNTVLPRQQLLRDVRGDTQASYVEYMRRLLVLIHTQNWTPTTPFSNLQIY